MLIVDVTGRVARLYQDDPRAFVGSRNLLARDLVRAGQRDLAARIKTLARPQTSAWLVNQLYWHERAEYDALLAAGRAMREAQQARLSGGRGAEFVRAMAERDAIVAGLAAQAERLAAAGGVTLTAETRQRVRTTLEAIALRSGDPQVLHGQLAEDVPLPGLLALAGLVVRDDDDAPAASRAPLTLVSEPEGRGDRRRVREALERELADVRQAVDELEAGRAAARDAVEVAEGALEAARLQAAAAQRALDAARERLAQAVALETAAAARVAATHAAQTETDARAHDLTARLETLEIEWSTLTTSRRRSSRPR